MTQPTQPRHLPVLPDADWQRVLCIVAHPDDMEYGTSAAVHTWTQRGIEVAYVLLTAGEAGMSEAPEVVAPIRAAEQRRACDIVGVRSLTILDHPDGMLEPGLDLRRSVAREIRKFRPDVVVTGEFSFEAYGSLNQADHRAAGMAVIDGTRDADNTWVFRELAEDEGLTKWRTKAILVAGSAEPTHALAVDQSAVDASVQSLQSHEAYLRHVVGHPDPADFIPEILRGGGLAAGTDFAVPFRIHDLAGLAG